MLKDIIRELANNDIFSECQSKYKFEKNANRGFMLAGLCTYLAFGRCVCLSVCMLPFMCEWIFVFKWSEADIGYLLKLPPTLDIEAEFLI